MLEMLGVAVALILGIGMGVLRYRIEREAERRTGSPVRGGMNLLGVAIGTGYYPDGRDR